MSVLLRAAGASMVVAAALLACNPDPRACASVSGEARARDISVSAGRAHRSPGTRDRAEALGPDGATVRGGHAAGRGRQSRPGTGRQGAAGRLYDSAEFAVGRDQSFAVREAQLRSGERSGADRRGRGDPERAAGPSVGARENVEGADTARAPHSRQIQLRVGRASAPRRISRPSSCRALPESGWCTCRTRARARR